MPLSFAASATAPAWFPEECVTTPLEHSSAVREKTALDAPLILKEPLNRSGNKIMKFKGGMHECATLPDRGTVLSGLRRHVAC